MINISFIAVGAIEYILVLQYLWNKSSVQLVSYKMNESAREEDNNNNISPEINDKKISYSA